jgi:hypothetical protein
MKRLILICTIALLSMGIKPYYAHSTLIWNWDFTPPSVTVLPRDDIFLYATIYNDAASTEDIYYTAQGTNFDQQSWGPGTLPWPGVYNFNSGKSPWSILYETGTSIGPGKTLTYLFGTLEHVGSPAPVGTYYSDGWLSIAGNNIQRQAEINVAPVPEPATMLLLGSGLIGLAGYGRKKFFKN